MTTLQYLDTAELLRHHSHGHHPKDLAVLHETVSPDTPGLGDILSVEHYLASKDYGIHGITDLEGHKAWAYGLGDAIFWQAGGVNQRSIGVEQVSNIPTQIKTFEITLTQAAALWKARRKQLAATAAILAAWHNTDPAHHPLIYSDGLHPGVTSHWDVSRHFTASEGHTDCWPIHKAGYFPLLEVIQRAVTLAKTGIHF